MATMTARFSKIHVETRAREEIVDITDLVAREARASGFNSGTCTIFSMHTTCAITVNENADPDVKLDLLAGLARTFPRSASYRHVEGNSDAHLKVSTVGPSVTVIVDGGVLVLGTWQGIMLCEFDGPRRRTVSISVQGIT